MKKFGKICDLATHSGSFYLCRKGSKQSRVVPMDNPNAASFLVDTKEIRNERAVPKETPPAKAAEPTPTPAASNESSAPATTEPAPSAPPAESGKELKAPTEITLPHVPSKMVDETFEDKKPEEVGQLATVS